MDIQCSRNRPLSARMTGDLGKGWLYHMYCDTDTQRREKNSLRDEPDAQGKK